MLAIIDYGMGNLCSVEKAFAYLGIPAQIISEGTAIAQAAGLVLPGVGAFAQAMRNLAELGLIPVLKEQLAGGKPFLGICLGLQLLFSESEEGEGGLTPGLGIFPGRVRRFTHALKIPQIGWNQLEMVKPSPLFTGVADGSFVYFVHAYYVDPLEPGIVTTKTDYGITFTSGVSRGNIYAVQFHPEKSSQVGLRILRNFGELVVSACNSGN